MSQIESIVNETRQLETLLTRLGAQGRGLHGKISSLERQLDAGLVRQLRRIATIRNHYVHEAGFCLKELTYQQLIRDARQFRNYLSQLRPHTRTQRQHSHRQKGRTIGFTRRDCTQSGWQRIDSGRWAVWVNRLLLFTMANAVLMEAAL